MVQPPKKKTPPNKEYNYRERKKEFFLSNASVPLGRFDPNQVCISNMDLPPPPTLLVLVFFFISTFSPSAQKIGSDVEISFGFSFGDRMKFIYVGMLGGWSG